MHTKLQNRAMLLTACLVILLLPCLCAAQSGRKARSTNPPTNNTARDTTQQTTDNSSSSSATNQQSGSDGGLTGTVTTGRRIAMPAPKYPKAARKQNIQGAVVVQITVDEKGKVISAQATSGHPLLREAAVKAAYKARFTPTLLDGQPVKVTGTLTYNFTR